MSDKYKIVEHEKAHFLTLTVVGWNDVFTRKNHKLVIVASLKYYQKHKGLTLLGWCLMSSHMHLIARADGKFTLSEITCNLNSLLYSFLSLNPYICLHFV